MNRRKHNSVKLKIFEVLYNERPKNLPVDIIARRVRLDKESLSVYLYNYHKAGYIGKRKGRHPQTNRRVYLYRLNNLGIKELKNKR